MKIPDDKAARLRLVSVLLAMAAAIWLVPLFYGWTGYDDCFISYGSASALVDTGEMLNFNGERVEQSSSLLHVIVLAVVHGLTGISFAWLGPLLGLLAFALVLPSLQSLLPMRVREGAGSLLAWLVVSDAYLGHWSTSGLETSLVALCLVGVVYGWCRFLRATEPSPLDWFVLAATTLAYCAARPEGPLVLLCAGLATAVLSFRGHFGAGRIRAAAPLFVTAAMFAALAIGRSLYFGAMFPEPVSAKSTGLSLQGLQGGLAYLKIWAFDFPLLPLLPAVLLLPMVVLGVAVLRRDSTFEPAVLVSSAIVVAGLGFTATSGGDWMGAGRFLAPLMPLAWLSVVVVCARLIPRTETRRIVLFGLVLANLTLAYMVTTESSMGVPPWAELDADVSWTEDGDLLESVEDSPMPATVKENRVHFRDIPAIGVLDRIVSDRLAQRPGEPVTLMSAQMGMIPFYLKERHGESVRFIDRRGLVGREVSGCKRLDDVPRSTGGRQLSYERFLSDAKAIREKCGVAPPDIIFDLFQPVESGVHVTTQQVDRGFPGYEIIYRQEGLLGCIPENACWRMPNFRLFIAVRDEG